MPAALKRKKPAAGSSSRVNAAPSLSEPGAGDADIGPQRPDLVSTLMEQFGAPPPVNTVTPSEGPERKKQKKNDDYAKFMDEVGDIL